MIQVVVQVDLVHWSINKIFINYIDSRSQSIYTIKDDVSQKLLNDIESYNKVLYKKINPKKKEHEKSKDWLINYITNGKIMETILKHWLHLENR